MSHFTDESWFDYVRRLLPPDQMDLMQAHLEKGCSQCREIRDVWQRVVNIVARESEYQPGARDIHVVMAALGTQRTTAIPMNWISAAVIYDSLRDTAPAGFRSALTDARHLLCEADQWTIALRLKLEPNDQVSLAGHVTQRGSPSQGSSLAVTLARGDTFVAQTATNGVGEFHLQYQDFKDLQLYVRVSDEDALKIDLPVAAGS